MLVERDELAAGATSRAAGGVRVRFAEEARPPSRFRYATGYFGHGFPRGPAVGEVIRDLHPERVPFVDISPHGVERFAVGAARPEVNPV